MSLCLYFYEEYKIRYSQHTLDNWNVELINSLFEWLANRLDRPTSLWCNGDFPSSSTILEMKKGEIIEWISWLDDVNHWEDIPEYNDDAMDWYMPKYLRDAAIWEEEQSGLSPIAFCNFLSKALLHSEPTINYVRFEWGVNVKI